MFYWVDDVKACIQCCLFLICHLSGQLSWEKGHAINKKFLGAEKDDRVYIQYACGFFIFFDDIFGKLGLKLNVVFSYSLRRNGRAMNYGDKYIVMLPFPDETFGTEELFFQLIHECTHAITDPLIQGIRMDDGSHDLAEYQVLIFDLWLMEKRGQVYTDKYVNWISKEILDECYEKLSDEQIRALKDRFG